MSTIMCTRSSIPRESRSCTTRLHSAMWGNSTAYKNSRVVEIFILTKLGIGLGLLIERRRLVTIVPPGLRDAARMARFCRGSAEHVPIGEPVRGLVPLRDPITAGANYPVEHPAGRCHARAAIGCDDLVDERIDDRIGNAGEILRAL